MAKKVNMTRYVPISNSFEQMIISAERYACGRMSYIVGTTVDYIISMLPQLSDWCICVMQNDMQSEFEMCERAPSIKNLGMECDYQQWIRFRDALNKEMEVRNS